MFHVRRLLLTALFAGSLSTAVAAADNPPHLQREQQKKILAEVERTARQVSTTLRVLTYQKVDPGTEQKVLEEVAGTLRGLGEDQMKAVLTHLDNASKTLDDATATAEQRAAYTKNRQIVGTLKALLVKLDTLKSLEHAADRYDKLAKDQHELHLKANRLEMLPARPSRFGRSGLDDREEQADAQDDLRTDLFGIMKQLALLKEQLTPEQKERLTKADPVVRSGGVVAKMQLGGEAVRKGELKDGADHQKEAAKELQSIAAALRGPRDSIAQLKDARDKIAKLIVEQESVKDEGENKPDPQVLQRRPGYQGGQDPELVHASQLAERQAKLEYDTREVRKAIETAAKEAASKLSPAEKEMNTAEGELRDTNIEKAREPQTNATNHLKEAKDALEKQIAQAEKDKNDPLAAIKNAEKMLDELIKDQKLAKELTEFKKDEPDELRPIALKQAQIARKTDELKAMPLPESKPFKEAMDKAADRTKAATRDLANKDAKAAEPKQDAALKAMEAAKKALEEKKAEIEKRREEMAKLDDAAKKLEELAKKEAALAQKAAQKAGETKPESKDLAKQQGELQPPTKEVSEQVKSTAPEAAKAIDDAAKKMESAQKNLQDQKPRPGAENAAEATKKLNEAQDLLAKKRDEMQAKEAADQAAMQPNDVNPQNAAQQLAKAIEQAREAADQANKAAEKLSQQQQPSLARLQEEVSKQAGQIGEKDASADAKDAAESLQKGDLANAMQQQQQALDKLNLAAQKGEKGQQQKGEKGQPQAGEVAESQKKLMEATKAMAQSAQANKEAQAALGQAQAQSPQAVKPQLDQANQQLSEAMKQLGQGQPKEAGQNQQQAADQLGQALNALNAAAEAMGQKGQQPGQPQEAQANNQGQQPGQKPGEGQQPGQGQQPSQQPGQQGQQGQQPGQPGQKGQNPQEKNEGRAEGDREGMGPNRNAAVRGSDAKGDGTFINLQKREREKVQQAAEAAFPAEFREFIKQYNINIKDKPKPPAPVAPAPEKK
jgi:hypothetical protein